MRFLRQCAHSLAVSAILSVFSVAAQAAIYTGHFDPPGDGFIPGFSGAAQFTIASDCFDRGNGFFFTSGEVPDCGPSTMDFAHVNLFPTDGSGFPTSPVDFFDVGTNSIIGVLIIGNQLEGVDTNKMGPQNGHSVFRDNEFWLQFESGCLTNPSSCIFDPAFIYFNSVNNQSNPATVVFTPGPLVIPEPGSLALILAAAGMAWMRRRSGRTK